MVDDEPCFEVEMRVSFTRKVTVQASDEVAARGKAAEMLREGEEAPLVLRARVVEHPLGPPDLEGDEGWGRRHPTRQLLAGLPRPPWAQSESENPLHHQPMSIGFPGTVGDVDGLLRDGFARFREDGSRTLEITPAGEDMLAQLRRNL